MFLVLTCWCIIIPSGLMWGLMAAPGPDIILIGYMGPCMGPCMGVCAIIGD